MSRRWLARERHVVSDWAAEESVLADFGDERLNHRYARIVSSLGNNPNLSIPAGCSGRAEMEATYRFIDNDKVTFEKILAPHSLCMLRRAAGQAIVLLVNDTTEIDLTRPHQQVAGAGGLDGSARRGIFAHVLHGFTPAGMPLGTLSAQIINRPLEPKHKGKTKLEKEKLRAATPIEQKESMRWLTAFREARQAAGELPDTQCIYVADSEADIYEILAEPRQTSDGRQMDLLVRGCRERLLAMEDAAGDSSSCSRFLQQAASSAAMLYTMQLPIRAREAKIKSKPRGRRHTTRSARLARLQVRAAAVRLHPPDRPDRKLPEVSINVVLANEVDAPEGEEPVQWILLTTLPIGTTEQVKDVLDFYCKRWNIELLFRTLKSGCRIEQRRFEQVQRVECALGLYLIAAWRTLFVTFVSRQCPEMDCQKIFEPSEWKAVWVATQRKPPPDAPPGLQHIVQLIAQLGGYIPGKNRKPGVQTIWIGMQRMHDLALAWDVFGPEARGNTS
jgi:hypothetical protein